MIHTIRFQFARPQQFTVDLEMPELVIGVGRPGFVVEEERITLLLVYALGFDSAAICEDPASSGTDASILAESRTT